MAKKNYQKLDEFKQNVGFNEKLGLDERDNVIMSLIQTNPNVSQEEIAKKIKLSQPSVGARLKRLKDKGILHTINGVNFKVVDLHMAKVDVNAVDPAKVLAEFKDCPFFLNALITSGQFNLCIFFAATDLKRLEGIVTHHLRGHEQVKDVQLNVIISTEKDFVMPLSVDYDNKNQVNCKQQCKECIHAHDFE